MQQIGILPNLSAGVPLTYCASSNDLSYMKLKNEFLDIPFSSTQGDTYRKNGFIPYLPLSEIFENKFTNTSGEKMQVRMMNFSDISRITLNFNADHQYVGDAKYNKLFIFGVRYYILEKEVCFIRGDTWNADILLACDSEQRNSPCSFTKA